MNIYEDMKDMEKEQKEKEIKKDIVKMIRNWSEIFDAPILEKKGLPDSSRQSLAFSLIEEELSELKEAINDQNILEIQDALGDILWVTVRAMMEYGIDPLKTIQAIYISNMSKLDSNYEDVMESIIKYTDQGIQVYPKKLKDGRFAVRRLSDDKILKSYRFKEPNFDF